MTRLLSALALAVAALASIPLAQADDASAKPVPSRHQLMKECMAKQKASNGGMPKEEMKRNCRDVTDNQRENDKAESKAEKLNEDAAESPKK